MIFSGNKTLTLFAISFMACACSDICTQKMEYINASCQSTKICLDESLSTVWDYGDEVAIFYKSDKCEKWRYFGEAKSSSGMLAYAGTHDNGEGRIIGLSPYDPYSSFDGHYIFTSIPSEQFFDGTDFCEGAPLLIAESDDNNLTFMYVTGIIRLEVIGTVEIDSLTFSGNKNEPLAGNVKVNPDDVSSSFSGNSRSILTIKKYDSEKIRIDGKEKFYFSTLPQSFYDGMRFTLYNNGKAIYSLSTTVPEYLERGNLITIKTEIK